MLDWMVNSPTLVMEFLGRSKASLILTCPPNYGSAQLLPLAVTDPFD